MLGPLVPSVLFMALTYNLRFQGFAVLIAAIVFWLAISSLISFVINSKGTQNSIEGNKSAANLGARLTTLLVLLTAQISISIFTTFAEQPIYAFLFILFFNLFGSFGALVGFYSDRLIKST